METAARTHAEPIQRTEPMAKPSLQVSLHTATQSKHANLNRSITHRLPLCLPPHAATPLPYHLGMLAFGLIYRKIEKAIDEVRQEQTTESSQNQDRLRHVQVAQRLFTDGLPRTQHLESDFRTLHERLLRTQKFPADVLDTTEERIRGEADASTAHIYERIRDKPYLSLAYAWAMYLALFNGGRWLLKQLEGAGSDFWLEALDRDLTQQPVTVLSFWHFEAATPEDLNADQLKSEFKQNFDFASSLLTDQEAAEVVEEGIAVFDTCSGLIELLDVCVRETEHKLTSSQTQVDTTAGDKQQSTLPMWQTLESAVIAPAYQIMRRLWTQSFRGDVSIAAG